MTALCDVNIWIALALPTHVHHERARAWLDGVDETESLLFCRATQQSFLRLITNPRMMAPYNASPVTNEGAWDVYEALLADDRVTFRFQEPGGLEERWREYAARPSSSPNLWMDAYLAAFAREDGSQLVTTDRAFRQFDGLDVVVLGEN